VDVDGGVSLWELAVLMCPSRLRASAVSLRASSSALVGLDPFVREPEMLDVESVDGRILAMYDHLLLLAEAGASVVNFGTELSAVLRLEGVAREWRLFVESWVVPDGDGMMLSKPKRLEAGECSSFRMMRRRRPGAG
jgi:hypothetical protein